MANWLFPKSDDGSLRAFAIKIIAKLSGLRTTDDNPFPVRLVEKEIRDHLYLATKQEDEILEARGEKPNDQRLAPFPCLKMVESTDFFCKCTRSGGRFLKVALPKFIHWQGSSYITYLGNTELSLPFVPTKGITAINAQIDYLNKPAYFLAGQNAYIALPAGYEEMCEVTVVGIPEDPLATTGPCFDIWSTEWNIPGYMRAIVEQRVMEALNPALSTMQSSDYRNNSQAGNQFPTITS